MDAMDENSAIRRILEGTATETGDRFFEALVLDRQPMPEQARQHSIFRIFAARATAEMLRQNAAADAAVLVDRLFQNLQDFTRGTLPEDDRTLVIAKIQETPTQ